MRWLLVGSVAALGGVALVGVAACSSTSGSVFDVPSSSSAEGGEGGGGGGGGLVTCYQLGVAGTVDVAPADACEVLGTGQPAVTGPFTPPPGLLRTPACVALCASVKGDYCIVGAAYVDAYGKTPHPQRDGGDGGSDGPDAAQYGCPDYADAGTVSIKCYAAFPYQAMGCPL